MRPSTTNRDHHRTGRGVSAVAALAAAGLLLSACGGDEAADGPEADVEADVETNEPGAVATADLEADEVVGEEPDDTATSGAGGAETSVALLDPTGAEVGTMSAVEVADGLEVTVEVTGLTPGFHGLHLHAVGLCEPESAAPDDPATVGAFLSAGGHLGVGESDHGAHAGDLPSLYVTADGTGRLTALTDGVTLADLTDDDGTAVMVHSGPDNFANIPERYAPDGPDQDTLNTGDSGDRVACGAVT